MTRYVYGIRHRSTGVMVYIGVGKGPRMFLHLRAARKGLLEGSNPAKGQYLIDHYEDLEEFKIAEELPLETALGMEQALIKSFGRLDLGTGTLLNANDGGFGCRNPAPSTREKFRKWSRKLWDTPGHREKMKEVFKQNLEDPEIKIRMTAAAHAFLRTPEGRMQASEAGRKLAATPEQRILMAERTRRQMASLEARARMAETKRRQCVDPIVRARLSEIARQANAKRGIQTPC